MWRRGARIGRLIALVAAILLGLMALGQPVLAEVVAPAEERCLVAPQSPGARFVAGSDGVVVDTVGGSSNAVTLGRYPAYVNSAAADGSKAFNVGDGWEAMANRPGRFGGTGEGNEIWIRNTRFLDDAVARGSEIRLASDPFAPANAGSFFLREVSYLEKLGYRARGGRMVQR